MSSPWDTLMEPHDAVAATWGTGSRLGRFELERRLGIGGMGEVFAARDLASGHWVALKTLANTHATLLYRFKREFRALADVEHPNLVRLGELLVPESGPACFTMELVDGRPFTAWVRGSTPVGQLPPLLRLAAALRQLVEGLECLHAHRWVHRDVKPSNVLVTEAGRVVILDFGIVSESTSPAGAPARESHVQGTPVYMAPEQAAASPAGPATDYYAVGVMLYECLTGRVPFSGSAVQLLLDKQHEPTPDPRAVAAELPARWRELCIGLLHRDPARRPSGPTILERLAADAHGRPPARQRPHPSFGASFVGRERELGVLRQALRDVGERRQAVAVHVRGASGLGKSSLVQRFLEGAAGEGGPLVLRGRCRERETVPYKGVDAVVDALSVHLRQLHEHEREALRPRHVAALTRVFPVLDELWPLDARERAGLDPNEARGLGWAALREVLGGLAERGAVVVAIDDFQWTDLDSVAILQAATRPPDAPALLLVITARDELADPRALAWLDDDARDVRRLELGPLPAAYARALALALLEAGRAGVPAREAGPLGARADAVALRSHGNPFFIGQLVLGGDAGGGSDLDQIVVHRLASLAAADRRVLELVAVAGGPLPLALVVALGDASPTQVDALCEQGLLVRSESEPAVVEAAHDRIRERTLLELSPARMAALHWQLGEALLARSAGVPGDDGVFEIVDHLDAGLASAASLTPARRLELARLTRRAGERALASAAWASARRYLGLGRRLIEPWLAEARRTPSRGGAPGNGDAHEGTRALSLAIAFGWAQAEAMAASELADAAFDELLTWRLSEIELARIVARRVAILSWQNRLNDAVDLGLAGLGRLGLAMPRRPSLARGLLEVLRGWLALGRRDVEVLRALPELRDEHVRARLDVLVEVSFAAPYVSPPLMLTLAGYSTRMIRRHGYHVGLVRILTQLGLAIGVLGKSRAAGALCDRALALARHRSTREFDRINARVLAQFMVWPTTRPLGKLLTTLEARVREACDFGLFFEAGYMSVAGGFYLLEIDRPLPEVAATLARLEARNPGFGGSVNHPGVVLVRRHVETLVDGRAAVTEAELGPALAMFRYMGIILELVAGVLLGDYDRATALMVSMPADHPQVLVGVLQIPRFAMYSVILEARRCPARGGERRRVLRRMRRHARTVRRWAAQGPESFGPMAEIIAGELAVVRGQYAEASAAFARARAQAKSNGAINLVALASLRAAVAARAGGEEEAAQAAFAAAIEAYEAWGATAVVESLRRRGLAGV